MAGGRAERAQSSEAGPTNLPRATLAALELHEDLFPKGTASSRDAVPCPSASLNVFSRMSRAEEGRGGVRGTVCGEVNCLVDGEPPGLAILAPPPRFASAGNAACVPRSSRRS